MTGHIPHPKKWRPGLYIRLSREDGGDVSYSVENQRDRLMQFLQGREEEFLPPLVYIDDGFTGTDSRRDGFQAMLRDVEKREIDCVVVKDLSRLSRNYIEAGHYLEHVFALCETRFISLELPALDSYRQPEQMNSILVPIQNVINDDFCRQTSVKIRGVFDQKRAAGEFIGAFAPYGYTKDPQDRHRLVADPEAARVVRDIFRWYACEGTSKAAIVRTLNELGIPCPSAYKRAKGLAYCNPSAPGGRSLWSAKTVGAILKNPVYLGYMVQGRQKVRSYKLHTSVNLPPDQWFVVENRHEPIVDRAVFDKAQRLAERVVRTPAKREKPYLFSGFLRCGGCGKALTRRVSKNTVYYACRTHLEQSRTSCGRHAIRLDLLEGAVLAAIQTQLLLTGAFAHGGEKVRSDRALRGSGQEEAALRRKRDEIERLERAADALYPDWKSGELTREEYRRLKEGLSRDIHRASQEYVRLAELGEREREKKEQAEKRLAELLRMGTVQSLDRWVLEQLVQSVLVHEAKEITIVFRIRDPYQQAAERENGG